MCTGLYLKSSMKREHFENEGIEGINMDTGKNSCENVN